jgi:hypothetical protein
MAKKIEVTEERELRWPDGAERVRIMDRKPQSAWKKNWVQYKDALVLELGRLGAASVMVCRGPNERLDPGVAVWFSMTTADFGWQQGLGIDSPAPRLEEIDSAFREKTRSCHPDRPDGGDSELFKRLVDWRQQAKAWVMGTHDQKHDYVMAIDQYTEQRLNLCALRLASSYIRGLKRVGAPAIVTQTLGAFRAKLTGGSSAATTAS